MRYHVDRVLKNDLRLFEACSFDGARDARKEIGGFASRKKKYFDADIGEAREDSERTEGWVSGRGNKRGSKSWPGPGLANKRAPAGSPRGGSSKL